MAELLRTFERQVEDAEGRAYRPRVCAREREDGMWEGWFEFAPEDGAPVLRSERETTQPNRTDVEYWASGLSPVYAEGALARTLAPIRPVRKAPADQPTYGGPAPTSRTPGNGSTAILDPFAVYRRGGGELLRRELSALDAWHLRNIAHHYRLLDGRRADLEQESKSALVSGILTAVIASYPDSERTARPRPYSRT
jgi:hypothetical protein